MLIKEGTMDKLMENMPLVDDNEIYAEARR